MTGIEQERDGAVAIVRLAHGKVNALDLELLQDVSAAFGVLAADDAADAADAVVLTGAGRAFSAGVDLHRILDGGGDYVRAFVPALVDAFLAVFTMPKPVVAAVNGHAIAGGCIFAAACDRRLMSGGRIGVTELAVGVPFPAAALEILRSAVGHARAAELVLSGLLRDPAEAQGIGLVDEVVDPGDLVADAVAEARRLAAVPAATFRHTKRHLHRDAVDAIARAQEHEADVVRLWASDEVADAIHSFVERTIGRPS